MKNAAKVEIIISQLIFMLLKVLNANLNLNTGDLLNNHKFDN